MLRIVPVLVAYLGMSGLATAGMSHHVVSVDGRERSYELFVPDGAGASRPMPLVLAFHGGGGQGDDMERLTHFSRLAAQEHFLVAYPNGVRRHWNDGRGLLPDEIDDVAFVRRLLDDVGRAQAVDAQRIYATGMSNGAIFSHYLGLKLADRLAAIAPVSGGVSVQAAANFHPAQALPVLMVQGTADPIVPYAGGPILRTHGSIVSTDRAVELWRTADGLPLQAASEQLPDADPTDGCRARRSTWRAQPDGVEVQLLQLEDGGHAWAGGLAYLPEAIIGRTCRDVDATELIWAFFRRHPRNH